MFNRFSNFKTWCETKDTVSNNAQTFNTNVTKKMETLFKDIHNAVNDEKVIKTVNIHNNYSSGSYKITRDCKSKNMHDIDVISINASGGDKINITLKNVKINKINYAGHEKRFYLLLDNCHVKKLSLSNFSQIEIVDSEIGILNFNITSTQPAIRYFSMKGGCILNIGCPLPLDKNPFGGPVKFNNVYVPKQTKTSLNIDAQSYRNIRHHLRQIENIQASNIFHSAELSIERETDNLSNKLISYLYETCSDFGNSWIRPIRILFEVILLSSLIIYLADGASIYQNEKYYTGWLCPLYGGSDFNKLARSAYLSFQTVYNPLGLFNYRALVIPTNLLIALGTWFQSIFSIILIFLSIFSVRRRFKIQT